MLNSICRKRPLGKDDPSGTLDLLEDWNTDVNIVMADLNFAVSQPGIAVGAQMYGGSSSDYFKGVAVAIVIGVPGLVKLGTITPHL